MEKYIDCKGYEGIYQISDLGNVKSLSRFINNGNSGYYSKEKLLKQTLNKKIGYYYISLCINGKPIKFYIHQLVAISFLNHNLDGTNKLVVDHIDSNKTNNKLTNLQVVSNRENCVKDKKSSSIGVYYYAKVNRFRARIRIGKQRIDLGQFKTELEATNAYQLALSKI